MPAPLLALIAVALIVGTAWTFAISLLQQPDEPSHAARVQRIAEGGRLENPVTRDWSTDQTLGASAANVLPTMGYPTVKPTWTRSVDEAYRRQATGITPAQRRDADAPTGADNNPAGYYLWGAAWYHLGGDFLTRAWVVRLSGALLLAASVVATWLLVGEVFGPRRILQTAGAALTALQPMVGSMSTAIGPDGMLITASTFTLWLVVRTIRRGLTVVNVAGLLVAFVWAAATKSTAFGLLPSVLLALVVAALRTARGRALLSRARTRGGAATLAGGLVVVLGGAFVLLRYVAPSVAPLLTGTLDSFPAPRRFASYLWQFYLGNASFLVPTPNAGLGSRFEPIWIEQAWGRFGPLDSSLSPGWFSVILWGGTLVAVLALVALVRRRRSVDWAVAAALVLAVVVTALGIHVTEFNLLASFSSGTIIQGRYALPLIGVGALVVAGALSVLRTRWRPPAAGVVVAVLVAISLSGLFSAASRYYAS